MKLIALLIATFWLAYLGLNFGDSNTQAFERKKASIISVIAVLVLLSIILLFPKYKNEIAMSGTLLATILACRSTIAGGMASKFKDRMSKVIFIMWIIMVVLINIGCWIPHFMTK